MRLVEILLPSSRGQNSKADFRRVMHELTERFGGATAHINSPAGGLWDDRGTKQRERIVTIEIMFEDFDEASWRDHRAEIEDRFHQEEIGIRATEMTKV